MIFVLFQILPSNFSFEEKQVFINDSDSTDINWPGYINYYSVFYHSYITSKYDNICFSKDIVELGDFEQVTQNGKRYPFTNEHGVYVKLLTDFFLNCEKRFSSVMVNFQGHANVLIYDSYLNQFELFDSVGDNPYVNRNTYDKYINKLQSFAKSINHKSKFFKPVDFFPEGTDIQGKEESLSKGKNYNVQTDVGFCVVWSLMYLEKRIQNFDTPRNEIVYDIIKMFDIDVDFNSKEIRKYAAMVFKLDSNSNKFENLITFVYFNWDFFMTVFKRVTIILMFLGCFVCLNIYVLFKCFKYA
jgi:hypothetical protein